MLAPGATIRTMPGDLEPLPTRVLSSARGADPPRLHRDVTAWIGWLAEALGERDEHDGYDEYSPRVVNASEFREILRQKGRWP